MLEAAEQGLGVTLGDVAADQGAAGLRQEAGRAICIRSACQRETIYLVSRTEQARDRRIGAVRTWIVEAVGRAK